MVCARRSRSRQNSGGGALSPGPEFGLDKNRVTTVAASFPTCRLWTRQVENLPPQSCYPENSRIEPDPEFWRIRLQSLAGGVQDMVCARRSRIRQNSGGCVSPGPEFGLDKNRVTTVAASFPTCRLWTRQVENLPPQSCYPENSGLNQTPNSGEFGYRASLVGCRTWFARRSRIRQNSGGAFSPGHEFGLDKNRVTTVAASFPTCRLWTRQVENLPPQSCYPENSRIEPDPEFWRIRLQSLAGGVQDMVCLDVAEVARIRGGALSPQAPNSGEFGYRASRVFHAPLQTVSCTPNYHLRFRLLEECHHFPLSEDMEFHILELPKFMKTVEELTSGLDIWLYFLPCAEDRYGSSAGGIAAAADGDSCFGGTKNVDADRSGTRALRSAAESPTGPQHLHEGIPHGRPRGRALLGVRRSARSVFASVYSNGRRRPPNNSLRYRWKN